MTNNVVSIIIPVLNDAVVLEKTLVALEKQSYGRKNIFITVVDNGSTDNSLNVAEKYADEVISLPHPKNPYVARNVGMRKATTEIIGLLDARCIPNSEYVEEMVNTLLNTNAALVAGNITFYNTELGIGYLIDAMVFITVKECVEAKEGVPGGALLFRKSLIDQIGYFREDWRSAADGEWSTRVWENELTIGYSENAIVRYSARSFKRLLQKGYRDGKGHYDYNRFKRIFNPFQWTIKSLLRIRPASFKYIRYCLKDRLNLQRTRYSYLQLSLALWVYRFAHSIGRLGF